MVHTLPAAPTAIGRHNKELNGVDTDMALRLAALTKAALKGKLPHKPVYHKNGLTSALPSPHTAVETRTPKTEATPTPGQAPLTIQPTPQSLISRHCSTLVHSRSTKALSNHSKMEHKLSSSLRKLRRRQLMVTHAHTSRQLEAYNSLDQAATVGTAQSGASESPSTHDESGGSSLDVLHSPTDSQKSVAVGPGAGEAARSLQQQLECLESFVDEDLTCSSSDDEDEEEESGRGRGRER